jgi:hypothetical protein
MGAMVAPVSFHEIAQSGQATAAQDAFTRTAMVLALVPFAAAIGMNLVVALGPIWGSGPSITAAILASTAALLCWFGVAMVMKHRSPTGPAGAGQVDLSTRISQMISETRIVLPGVQALLGFQYAAYLTEPFRTLGASGKIVHTASLFLLLASMIVLMAPAPFHRIAERGLDTERVLTVGVRLILSGLALLGVALAGDFYVALLVVTDAVQTSAIAAILAGAALLAAWFALPWALKARPPP